MNINGNKSINNSNSAPINNSINNSTTNSTTIDLSGITTFGELKNALPSAS